MQKPTNSAAEQIVSLRSINADIDTQIASLQATQQRHLETITAFEEIATWEEIVEEVVEEILDPEAEPAPTPEPVVDADTDPIEEVASDAESAPV